jgi:methionyl-tRNA formyltransferase
MEPQFAGSTIHKIVLEADAGSVLQQTVPTLSADMGIHDVGAATVKAGCEDLVRALELFKNGQNMTFSDQKTSGRLFLTKDFLPHHLRVNYNLFGDKMTKAFLEGSLGNKMPRLIQNI